LNLFSRDYKGYCYSCTPLCTIFTLLCALFLAMAIAIPLVILLTKSKTTTTTTGSSMSTTTSSTSELKRNMEENFYLFLREERNIIFSND
jgi:hypothetical protein